MKKKLVIFGAIFLGIVLGGCSKKEENMEITNSGNQKSEVSSNEKVENETSIFKGQLAEHSLIDKETVRLSFEKVETIKDPDKIKDSLNANGIVLLAPVSAFTFDESNLAVGQFLEFTLKSPLAMTFSIPPQISGHSINSIKQVD